MKNKFLNKAFLLAALSFILFACEEGPNYEDYSTYYPEQTVSGMSPSTGYPGTNLTITGENFGDLNGAVKVFFGGIVSEEVVSCADNQIVVKVPADAVTGKVSLQLWTHVNDSIGSYTVIPAPVIESVDPLRGVAGDTITITGERFGTGANGLGIYIGDAEANIYSINDNEIKITLPDVGSANLSLHIGELVVPGPFMLVGGELLTSDVIIGHSGSWGNNPATYISAAFDGDFSTFVDAPSKNGFVGYDFGTDQAANITSVRYVPRADQTGRMKGGEIRGANDPGLYDAVTLYTITEAPTAGEWTEAAINTDESYRYIYYYSADGFCNISELEFYGNYVASTIPEGMHNYEFYLNPRTVTLDVVDDWIGRDNQPGTTTVIEDGYCKVSFTPSDGTNKARADFNYSQGGNWGTLDKAPWVYHPDYPIYAIKIHFVQADGSLGGPRPAIGTVKYDRLGNFNDDYADQNVLWVDARGWSDVPKTEGSWWAVVIADILSDEQGYWVDWHRTFRSVEELEAFIGQ